MKLPFFEQLEAGNRFLIAGIGGGFDVAHGLPLYHYLTQTLKKSAILTNFSFSNVAVSNSNELVPGLFEVTRHAKSLQYFPERLISVWWYEQYQQDLSIYTFSNQVGVRPMSIGLQHLIELHQIDTLLLVDGGTDSLIFGDEEGIGTIVEDAISMVAASLTTVPRQLLAAVGFGIDHFHNINHYNYLENVATIVKSGGYLGAFSLTKEMVEGAAYIELTDYLNAHNFSHSIVNNSIASALEGDFGDYHRTPRTQGATLFINPLMALYWTFELHSLIAHMGFASLLTNTNTLQEAMDEIRKYRLVQHRQGLRHAQALPL